MKKNLLRDSEISIVLEDFLLKNFNIQEFAFSTLTLKLRFLVGLSTDSLGSVCFGVRSRSASAIAAIKRFTLFGLDMTKL